MFAFSRAHTLKVHHIRWARAARTARVRCASTKSPVISTVHRGLGPISVRRFRCIMGPFYDILKRTDRSRSILAWAHLPQKVTRENAEGLCKMRMIRNADDKMQMIK